MALWGATRKVDLFKDDLAVNLFRLALNLNEVNACNQSRKINFKGVQGIALPLSFPKSDKQQ